MTSDKIPAEDEQDAPWTLWTASYAYASAMREVVESGSTDHGPEFWDVPTMLVAFAIADYADQNGISAVTSPQDLADLSIGALYNRVRPLSLAMALSKLSHERRSVIPALGEPAHDQFAMMKAEIDDFNAGGVRAVLTDPRRLAKAKSVNGEWYNRGDDAELLITRTVIFSVDDELDLDADGDATLRLLAERVPGYIDSSPAAVLGATRTAESAPTTADAKRRFDHAQERVRQTGLCHGEGFPAAAGRDLLAILLYLAAHDRDEPITGVPWSAVRARTLFDESELLTYLTASLAALGHYTTDPRDEPDIRHALDVLAADPAARALRHLRSRHWFEGFDSSDMSSDPGFSNETHVEFGLPHAVTALDQILLQDCGGFAIGSMISAKRQFITAPQEGKVLGAVWTTATPPDGRPGMVDLEPGGPAGYHIRFQYGDESRVRAENCSRAVPPTPGIQP